MPAFVCKSQHSMLRSPPQPSWSNEYGSTLLSLQCLVYRSIQCCDLHTFPGIYNIRYYICLLLCAYRSIQCCTPLPSLVCLMNHGSVLSIAAFNVAIRVNSLPQHSMLQLGLIFSFTENFSFVCR